MNRVKFYVAGKIDLLPRRPLSVIIIYFFSNDIYIYIYKIENVPYIFNHANEFGIAYVHRNLITI